MTPCHKTEPLRSTSPAPKFEETPSSSTSRDDGAGQASPLSVALAGNPNSGKTTIFNALTGERQHVGNWPGKTVERKHGGFQHGDYDIEVVDLPGTYSLTAYSVEEIIARNYILSGKPDVVVAVVDASNLERNLYLVVQILELQAEVIVALNMSDRSRSMGQEIDVESLSQELDGAPVIPMTALKGEGVQALREAIVGRSEERRRSSRLEPQPSRREQPFRIDYGAEIEEEIRALAREITRRPHMARTFDPYWLSIKLLEGDEELQQRVRALEDGEALLETATEHRARLQQVYPQGLEVAIADRRYAFVNQVVGRVLHKPEQAPVSPSERIDDVVTHRWLGIPIFLAVMYLVFHLVVDVSEPFLNWVDAVVTGPLSRWAAILLTSLNAPAWLQGLMLEGVIAGVGGVLVFVPGLAVLFFFIGLLEDSGYLARAAVVTDRFMSPLGLRGKSFVPMLLGFGCAVPAIYATRTLESHRDRLLTALLVPFMSCSARLPVYVLFSLAFFGSEANFVIWSLYAFGVAVAVASGLLFSRTLFKGQAPSLFVMELPAYQLPSLKSLWHYVTQRTGHFIRNAGTVILVASVVIWLLLNLPPARTDLRHSLYGRISAQIAPTFQPAGFGTWEAAGSLISGLIGKEIVVSSMSQIYVGETEPQRIWEEATLGEDLLEVGAGFLQATMEAGKELVEVITPGVQVFEAPQELPDTPLRSALQEVFSPLSALAFLIFVLLYVPCVATLGAIAGEFGGKWAVFSAFWQTGIAWLMATLVYQVGTLLGFA